MKNDQNAGNVHLALKVPISSPNKDPVPSKVIFHQLKIGGSRADTYYRVFNRIIFHFPVSEGNNRVDNRIAKVAKIIG